MVVLRYFLDPTERETAAELGISVGTVKLYAGTQQSITIDVNGREAPVSALWNDPTGWTIFCDERRLPPPVEDDVDAPGTRPPVTVRFNVYDGSTRLLSQAAMPGIDIVLLGGRPTCTG